MVKLKLVSIVFIFFVNLTQANLSWAGNMNTKMAKEDDDSRLTSHQTMTHTLVVNEDNNNQPQSLFSIFSDEVFLIILDNLPLPSLSPFMRVNKELQKRIGNLLRYLSNEKPPRYYYQRNIIQDPQRRLDFEQDVANWKGLCSLSLQLISEPLFEQESQQQASGKNIVKIKLLSPDVKTTLSTLVSVIKPDTAFWYYLDALYRSWFSDQEKIEKFFEERKAKGQSCG